MLSLEEVRENIIGIDQEIDTPFGKKKIVYADWIAGGRLYGPIEDSITHTFGPYVANTHSESSYTGATMTRAYHDALNLIKRHVNADEEDVILATGTGMTGAISKLQRILGLRIPEQALRQMSVSPEDRPVIFVTHMEHHSNQTSWLECIADLIVVPPGRDLLVDPVQLELLIDQHVDRKIKIGCFTACSNVTGVRTPYHDLARIMHRHGGWCFVDFAASAPYDDIDMHPDDPESRLDAIFFSPHKFLGGPGSSGILIFNKELYNNAVPDQPGGGTVKWTDPWGGRSYFDEIEIREDGGTPGFLQAIRAALCIRLKEEIGTTAIHEAEDQLLHRAFEVLKSDERIRILAPNQEDRLGVISFYVNHLHFNLIVALLNDRFGIQVRGGCSCAGTYGHLLLNVDPDKSHQITCKIDEGDLTEKPGWVRVSLHPTMTMDELDFVLNAILEVVEFGEKWAADYSFDNHTGEFTHREFPERSHAFDFSLNSPVVH
jgi:selenocysteine lyase/cysteine desulfurase